MRPDVATVAGVVVGFAALLVANSMEGGTVASLMNPSAALIVFGGTIGATLVSFPLERLKPVPQLMVRAFTERPLSPPELVGVFVELAEKARREGLLALEQHLERLSDPFLRKGVLLVVDGTDPEVVRTVLETEVGLIERRHHAGFSVLEAMGGYAPTMGIIGTVMGLINVLGGLEDPSELGHAIAVAFVATLYGVSSANLLWLPLASKLKAKSQDELLARELMVEGILSVQAGDNPRLVKEKLMTYVAPREREGHRKKESGHGTAYQAA